MAPILGDFDEIVGPNIAPECRWVHGYDGMLNRLKVRPPIGLRNAADNLVGERASPTTVGEHDHSVSRGIAHHIALKDCRPAMLEVNLRRGSSYARAQTPPDALRWPHACRHHHPCHLLIEHTVRFSHVFLLQLDHKLCIVGRCGPQSAGSGVWLDKMCSRGSARPILVVSRCRSCWFRGRQRRLKGAVAHPDRRQYQLSHRFCEGFTCEICNQEFEDHVPAIGVCVLFARLPFHANGWCRGQEAFRPRFQASMARLYPDRRARRYAFQFPKYGLTTPAP